MRLDERIKKGGPLEPEEGDIPAPGHEEMPVRAQACGHNDAGTVMGILPDVRFPRIPGHQAIEAVDAIGVISGKARFRVVLRMDA